MAEDHLVLMSKTYLHALCVEIAERSVGSEGNWEATRFFEQTLAELGWDTETQEFDAMDWLDRGASLLVGGESFDVLVSPYAPGCRVEGELVGVSTVAELEDAGITGKIVLLHGEIAREQLMPKNFVFYNPEETSASSPCWNGASRLQSCAPPGGIPPWLAGPTHSR